MTDTTSSKTTREKAFLAAFQGKFVGILRWEQLDTLWTAVLSQSTDDWYVYQVGDPCPETPIDAQQLHRVIEGLNHFLREEHEEDYCGIVYADSLTSPSFIKIFDPNHLGSSCGSSGMQVFPGWILSRIQPVDLPSAFPPPNNRRRWWRQFFS